MRSTQSSKGTKSSFAVRKATSPRRATADTAQPAQSAALREAIPTTDVAPSRLPARESLGTATTDADFTAANTRTLSEAHIRGLERRGLDPEIAARHGWHTIRAKFAGKDGLAIPIIREGRVINHEYRGPRDGKKKIKLQDSGAPRAFWNEDVLRDDSVGHLPVMICEGMMDGLSGAQVADGLVRTIAVTDGARSNLDFFQEILPLLERVPRYILAGHRDADGQHLNQELARRLGAARCAWIDYPDGTKDLNEVLQEHGQEVTARIIDQARPYPIKGLYKLSEFPEVNLEVRDTGWISLNPFIKLWTPELMVITGIPQHGKSKVALHMLMQQCELYGSRAAVFSAEVPIKPHVRAEMRRFHGGEHGAADDWIEENFNFILADPRDVEEAATLKWIIEKAGDAVIRHGIDWLMIDPWNQVEHDRGRDSIAEYQEKMFKLLNVFRWQFNCGVMICAHPTKGVLQKDGTIRVPTLYDIDGSAHWYNAPDHGVVVDRPNSSGNDVRFIVKKSRFFQSGVVGEAWLQFDSERGRYKPMIDPPEVK